MVDVVACTTVLFCFSTSWRYLAGAMGWDETMVDDERKL
jgi:hypothetical protein